MRELADGGRPGARRRLRVSPSDLRGVLTEHERLPLRDLRAALHETEAAAGSLRTVAPLLVELDRVERDVSAFLRRHPLDGRSLEALVARRAIPRGACASARPISRSGQRFSTPQRGSRPAPPPLPPRERRRRRRPRARALPRSPRSSRRLPPAQLTPEQKALKKRYAAGRRELEHEFGKVMRYQSIRDLVAGDTGLVSRDLKPIWLMSPLSVSDTLPLDADCSTSSIFDEASQIPLEEAMPALFRAQQVIVVGDRDAAAADDFFSRGRREDETSVGGRARTGERSSFDARRRQLPDHAGAHAAIDDARLALPQPAESLISFSNAAFYERQLADGPGPRCRATRTTTIA